MRTAGRSMAPVSRGAAALGWPSRHLPPQHAAAEAACLVDRAPHAYGPRLRARSSALCFPDALRSCAPCGRTARSHTPLTGACGDDGDTGAREASLPCPRVPPSSHRAPWRTARARGLSAFLPPRLTVSFDLCAEMFSTCQKTQELWMWKMEYLHHEQRPLYFGEWF